MNLATLTARIGKTGANDPDTLHGLLLFAETPGNAAPLSTLVSSRLLAMARAGQCGRVPSVNRGHAGKEEIEGLFPRAWKRALIELMLLPNGATTADLATVLHEHGDAEDVGGRVSDIRADLRTMGMKLEAVPVTGQSYRYSITGHSAWRMQKIIANGWRL